MRGRQILQRLAWIVGFALAFFVFLWVGFAVQSCRAWRAGEQALNEAAESMAQSHFERSIRSHCPWNVWGKRSAARLEEMARGYEQSGAVERAIDTYEGLMTALAATDTGWSRLRRAKIEQLGQKVLTLRRELKRAK